MQQHNVPQNITGFEFKLVGFLTLRQFGFLAGAAILSFVFYLLFEGLIRWFLTLILAFFGLGLAFFTVNSISFDKWIVLFIRAIFSSSRRAWQKEPKQLAFLAPEFSYYLRRSIPVKEKPRFGRRRLEFYLSKLRARRPADKLDIFGKNRLSKLPFSAGETYSQAAAKESLFSHLARGAPTATEAPREPGLEKTSEKIAGPGFLPKGGK